MADTDQPRYIVAFEIGSSKIRGAVGIVDRNGVVDVVATEEERLIDKVRHGYIENNEVSNTLLKVVERLEAYPRVAPRRITGAYVALGGRSVLSTTVDVDITLPSETEITRAIIMELIQKAAGRVEPGRDVVDVVPVRFTVDGKSQVNPVGTYGSYITARMTVVSCTSNIKRMLRRVVSERAMFNIADYVNRTLAEADMVLTDDEKRLGCMLVDFGAETTSVAIFRNGSAIYQATLPIGSRNITLDLTSLNYTEERAEEIKRVSGNAIAQEVSRSRGTSLDDVDFSEINNFVHARADEIIANIMAQLEYAGIADSDLGKGIVVVGGGARLRGFNELLSQTANMPVRQGAPNASVRISDGSIHGSDAVDVISILAEAAKRPEEKCVEIDETIEETPDNESIASGYEAYLSGQTADDNVSRIGLDDVEIDENGDPVKPRSRHNKEKEDNQPKTPKKNLMSILQDRVFRMLREQEDEE